MAHVSQLFSDWPVAAAEGELSQESRMCQFKFLRLSQATWPSGCPFLFRSFLLLGCHSGASVQLSMQRQCLALVFTEDRLN
jgi:hypothetical protein